MSNSSSCVVVIGLGLIAGCARLSDSTSEALGKCSGVRIVAPVYPVRSTVIATKDVVADYAADPTGTADATAKFQQALDDVAALGGGTVWAPAGTYRFDGPLRMPSNVALRGDWKQPTLADSSVGGTVFAIRYTGGAFLTFTGNAGVDGASFWYPNQNIVEPIQATAIAFEQAGNANVRSVTITNITLVNPWIGIDTVSLTPDDTGGHHLIENVYGSPLHTGILMRATSSVSRSEEIHLAATYWASSRLAGSPSKSLLTSYLQTGATALEYDDNWGSYNLTIDDYATGILFDGRNKDDQVTGQEVVGLEIHGANRALDLEGGNNFYVNNAVLQARAGTAPTAVYVAPGFGKGSLVLQEVELVSGGIAIDAESPDFSLQLVHDTFTAWRGYAVKATGADLVLAGSTFPAQGKTDKHLSLGAAMSKVIVMANSFAGGLMMDSQVGSDRIWINNEPLVLPGGIVGFAGSGLGTHLDVPSQPRPARVDPSSLFDVSCYGAVPDCRSAEFDADGKLTGSCTDNTAAFQAALDAAGAAGGGTVYVPPSAGKRFYYFAGHLAVPAGVELVGPTQDRMFEADEARGLLVVEGDDQPFIALAAHAGVRGMSVWYSNQNGYHPRAFGPTLQAQGAGDWLVQVELSNATDGIDFGTYGSDAHFINHVSLGGYGTRLFASKSSSGFIGDFSAKGQRTTANSVLDIPNSPSNPPADAFDEAGTPTPDGFRDTDVGQVASVYDSGVGLMLGSAKHEVILNAYVHSPYFGLQARADGPSGGPSLTLIHYGSESFTGIDLEALDPVGAKIVLANYHTLGKAGYPENGGHDIVGSPYLIVGEDVAPTTPISFFTLANHSATPIGYDLRGGKIVVQDVYSDLNGNDALTVHSAVKVRGGSTTFAMIAGRFINPLDPGYTINNADASPNVSIAGVSLASALSLQGPVYTHYQPLWLPGT